MTDTPDNMPTITPDNMPTINITSSGANSAISGTGSATVVNFQTSPPRPVDEATLAAAQAQLDALPLDHIPAPAALPPGSRMLLSPNPLFVGRGDDLRRLAASLKTGTTAAISPVAATGLGGIGKTQLAVEFVHRYGHYFAGGVSWLSLADPATIPTEIAACGDLHQYPYLSSLPLADQVRHVLSDWQSPLPRLLVFDNCEDEDLLATWRPPSGGARVLVTSQRSVWDPTLAVQMLPIDTLPRAESIRLLCAYRPDLPADHPILDAIADLVGDLPLALHLAGSYLSLYQHDCSPQEYLAELQSAPPIEHESLEQGEGRSPTDHVQSVHATFAVSYRRLNPADPTDNLALALMERAACFAPGAPIPRAWLRATLAGPPHAREFGRAVRCLEKLGLLESEVDGALRLHRLLASFVQNQAAGTAARAAAEDVLLRETTAAYDVGQPAQVAMVRLHLRHMTEQARQRTDALAAYLCEGLGVVLHQSGDIAAAKPFLERVLAIREQLPDCAAHDIAQGLHNLASVLHTLGEYTEARSLFERALTLREQTLGPMHPDTATTLDGLSGVLMTAGERDMTRLYAERALAIREYVLGPVHLHVATSLVNLALLLREQAEYATAQSRLERALSIHMEVRGPAHPDTAISLDTLASVLGAQGKYTEAQPLAVRALEIREEALGPMHPLTATSLNTMAVVLLKLGDHKAARPLFERALSIREQVLGPTHPETIVVVGNLATLRRVAGDYAGAASLMHRVALLTEQQYGSNHPATADALNNLGISLDAIGRRADAMGALRRALALREDVLGRTHPDTATSLDNLAAVLQDQGDHAAAYRMHRRAWAIRRHVLGADHPDTAASLNNLALVARARGDLVTARRRFQQALEIRERVLGPTHPDTAASLANLATLILEQGDTTAAIPLLERSVPILEAAFGPEHPDTIGVRANLAKALQHQGR